MTRWAVVFVLASAVSLAVVLLAANGTRWFAVLGGAVATPTLAAESQALRVGLVSGHRNSDSGAACSDGLTEAQLNESHAQRVASILRTRGYAVDILDEFDPRLRGYRAAALVSIHADSCAYINDFATGFKVARAASRAAGPDDYLVECLIKHYAAATGLRFHANSVTRDMTHYHTFREIDPSTPAAIIETGFMYLDRDVLTRRADRVAQGIAEGILCFLRR
ncbi:MAG: N-acetylmuramoyl-L-alanine amidase [Thermoflexales bacterium]|nr:N-acetylmuramoyl-L-alanine amidase [Thermoflexales bacterium]MCS7324774.1 N-acetylmuramoyl-L-alanine amidase [Thermoflexales bacterium]MCX7939342.1 N-acetylmuramoyl-L-alanine amidase [Thermoflexales bacterium]MDW8053098.1 N-acetylmuramoyl-L-alanine amidase [Anaerolineae bacterium]MDW8291751.1 N-acetylmuramoyl-L-alanine amidase [Anaerolineae bacterium]